MSHQFSAHGQFGIAVKVRGEFCKKKNCFTSLIDFSYEIKHVENQNVGIWSVYLD